jgi:hypothetical protein
VNTIKNVAGQLGWPTILSPPSTPPLTADQFTGVITTQIDDELRWSSLVSSIAPLCRQDLLFRGIAPIFGNPPGDPIATMLNAAITDIHAQFLNIDVRFAGLTPNSIVRGRDITFGDITPTFVMPPTVATSLERIANDEDTIVSHLPKPKP